MTSTIISNSNKYLKIHFIPKKKNGKSNLHDPLKNISCRC